MKNNVSMYKTAVAYEKIREISPEEITNKKDSIKKEVKDLEKFAKSMKIRKFDDLGFLDKSNRIPIEVSEKLKRLDREKLSIINETDVFERLYKSSILAPMVLKEKESVLNDWMNNKWVTELVQEEGVLYSCNGVSLVYEIESGDTYLDLNTTATKISQSNKIYGGLKQPTFVTKISEENLHRAMSNLEVD